MNEELPVCVPGPVPPDDPEGWYAPAVRSQYAVSDGIVATVTEREDGYRYRTREPPLSTAERAIRETVQARFRESRLSRPRTRADAVDRVESGLPDRFRRRLGDLDERSPASRRRLTYHLLASLHALGSLTSFALDDRIRIADTSDDGVTVHTRDFAPAQTDLDETNPSLDRFLGERVTRRSISFLDFEIPVTVVRRHVLGADAFETEYVIGEPDLFPGDRVLIETVKDRILEAPPDGVLENEGTVVLEQARTLLGRRISPQPLSQLHDVLGPVFDNLHSSLYHRLRDSFAECRRERIDSLAYYVTRDLVGDGPLTVPIRDPSIRSIEANRVGDRITVVSHRGEQPEETRMPTTLSIDDTAEFVDLTRSLAAEGGVELSVDSPTATVTLERMTDGGPTEMHCSVSLPDGSSGGHVSLTGKRTTPPTPIALVDRGELQPELVGAIWTAAANRGTVLFVGPVDADPAAFLAAHAAFIPAENRPVEIGPAASRVDLPQETALAVSRPRGADSSPSWHRQVELDALHPDVAIIAGLDSTAQLEGVGHLLASGRPVFGAVQAADRDLFAHLVREAAIGHEVLSGVDLVVELPDPSTDDTASGWVPVRSGTDEVRPTPTDSEPGVDWNRVFEAESETEPSSLTARFAKRFLGPEKTDQSSVERAYTRRTRYVSYLAAEGATDRESLTSFLSDLRTDETATIERIQTRNRA